MEELIAVAKFSCKIFFPCKCIFATNPVLIQLQMFLHLEETFSVLEIDNSLSRGSQTWSDTNRLYRRNLCVAVAVFMISGLQSLSLDHGKQMVFTFCFTI